jgi:hypothetical protein
MANLPLDPIRNYVIDELFDVKTLNYLSSNHCDHFNHDSLIIQPLGFNRSPLIKHDDLMLLSWSIHGDPEKISAGFNGTPNPRSGGKSLIPKK